MKDTSRDKGKSIFVVEVTEISNQINYCVRLRCKKYYIDHFNYKHSNFPRHL